MISYEEGDNILCNDGTVRLIISAYTDGYSCTRYIKNRKTGQIIKASSSWVPPKCIVRKSSDSAYDCPTIIEWDD